MELNEVNTGKSLEISNKEFSIRIDVSLDKNEHVLIELIDVYLKVKQKALEEFQKKVERIFEKFLRETSDARLTNLDVTVNALARAFRKKQYEVKAFEFEAKFLENTPDSILSKFTKHLLISDEKCSIVIDVGLDARGLFFGGVQRPFPKKIE